jgi:hypothetical protein
MFSQEPAAKPRLNIVVVEGEGAINNVKQRTARPAIVQVEDEVFTLPASGPGGTFANGSRILTVLTNEQGRAIATGFRPNALAGNFQMHVNASHQGLTGSTTVSQSNSAAAAAGSAGISGKLIAVLVAAAGAAAGGVIATRKDEDTVIPPKPTVSISAGAPSVGGPPR